MSDHAPARLLLDLAMATRDDLVSHAIPLAGSCEGAAGDLADALADRGYDVAIVWGAYDARCPDGYPTTGHCWVRSGALIADPTRGQFDDGPLVSAIGHSDAARYLEHHALLRSAIDRED